MEPQQLRATIALAQAGSAEGYQVLLEAYGPRLYGYFLRATGRVHDAEDMLGEIMLRLVGGLKHYDDRGRFEPWLFRIAANLVRDHIRRLRTKPPPMSLSAAEDSGPRLADRIAGDEPAVDAPMVAAESAEKLHEALGKLDAKTREMVLLRHFGQMSFREIAEMFDCPMGTALARVHRGLRRLRLLLEGKNGTG
ncbi:MAG: sigma-70 family RNA polymerase sigma factor [Planctomycetota bacterium]|nr:sigma-70 family RNA polymerase sigma factor [Planctomycetota bacterium]